MNDFFEENPLSLDLPTLDLTRFSEPHPLQAVGEKYLVFFLGEKLYALASNTVAEVAASLAVTKLPSAPEWLLGIINLRGEILAVLNLSAISGESAELPSPKLKFIVLRSRVFESGVAFATNRVSEIVTIADEAIERINDEKTPHVFGKTVHKAQTLNLIDAEKLLSTLSIN